eukprot:9392710-Prorocentrum_lima.AAC.1
MTSVSSEATSSGNVLLRCPLPSFEGPLPITCSVAVSFNGTEYFAAEGTFTMHDFQVSNVEPMLQPIQDHLAMAVMGS